MANYFRSDGWVKSALGPAVPGSQIYVCLQPANIATLPPSPLANIFSDPNGLVPLPQPVITDGFGHYDFYMQAGVYTLVVGLGGIIQQVYPDQSSGGASPSRGGGSGTALVLQTNGTNNANQLLLNLIGAGSIVVTDEGNGTIAIAGAVFQTNGAPNTVQNKLNLVAGTGMALSSDSLGDVTISSTVSGTPIVNFMFGPGFITPQVSSGGVGPSPDSANQVIVTRFNWVSSLTFDHIRFAYITGASGVFFALGIYSGPSSSSPGTLLWSSGALSLVNFTNATTTFAVPSYTLLPGDYYLATTTNASPSGLQIYGVAMSGMISGATTEWNGPPIGTGAATNASTNGPLTLPSTLGTILVQGGNGYGYPLVYFT